MVCMTSMNIQEVMKVANVYYKKACHMTGFFVKG